MVSRIDLRGPTLRWRASCGLLTVLVIAAVMTAGCGGTSSSTAGQNGSTGKTSTHGNSAATNGPAGMVRLGCGQFCLQAGGYGGGPAVPNMTKILTTQVTVLPDGTVPITIKSLLFAQPATPDPLPPLSKKD